MGQQQLLLLVLSAIIVGISIVVGINMVGTSAYQSNREAVMEEAATIASRAQEWYRKPVLLGGGGRSFDDLDDLDLIGMSEVSANGTYSIVSAAGDEVQILATGRETDSDGDSLKVTFTIGPSDISTSIDSGT